MHILTKSNKLLNLNKTQYKYLWEWVNIMFNAVDEDRLKLFGPDRTCAEWLLRNGASVKFNGHQEFLRNYNRLPPEGTKLVIKEVDASESSIKHYGFPHFKNCNSIDTLILHHCSHVEDKALQYLHYLQNSLSYLQVSSCHNITSKGLLELTKLHNLKKLSISDLPYVKDKEKVLIKLKETLPNCTINYN